MILREVHIRKYKSIEDSGPIPVEDGVTCLVGKNESGKTAVLEALHKLNPVAGGEQAVFNELFDYPRRLRGKEKKLIPTVQPVEASFDLDDEDVQAVEDNLGKGVLRSRRVTVSKTYENETAWTIDLDEATAVRYLVEMKKLDASFAVPTVGDLRDRLAEEVNEDDPGALGELLGSLGDFDVEAQAQEVLAERMPEFLYFSRYNEMPGRVPLASLRKTPSALNAGERTALSLLKLAGVGPDEFEATEYEAQQAALETASAQISDEVFEYWSQNDRLQVRFQVDRSGGDLPGPVLDVRIWNDRHRTSLNFGERSAGFVWFFSFLAYFSEFEGRERGLVLLLDEPGLNLHASAQADLLRFIDDRLAPGHQVVYSTHSPFLVDPAALNRVRTVEDVDGEGTKVSADVLGTSRDTLFPLQGALGYQLAQTLFVGPDNLVVEGPSDYVYLTVVSEHLRSLDREGLNPRWTIVPAGGLDKVPTFIALLGSQLRVTVVLDVAAGGSQKIDRLVERGLLAPDRLIPLTQVTDSAEADIEDLFDADLYLELLRASGAVEGDLEGMTPNGRIVKRVEAAVGGRYNHYTPAALFLRKQGDWLPRLDNATLDRFESLFARVNQTLS